MLEFGKREWAAAVAIAGALIVGGTGWWTLRERDARQAAAAGGDLRPAFPDGTPAQRANADGTLDVPARGAGGDPSGKIEVFVSGAVKHPGVYTLPSGERVDDAIHAAGGFQDDARTDALNLADFVHDAEQVAVPVQGEAVTTGAPPLSVAPSSANPTKALRQSGVGARDKFKKPGDGVVNVNTASLEELEKLPGVGPGMAQRILDYRTQIGRFAGIEQIQDVRGIGPRKFEKIRPFVVVN